MAVAFGWAQDVVLDALAVDAGLADASVAAGLDSAAGFASVEGLLSAAPESVAGFSAELDEPLGA